VTQQHWPDRPGESTAPAQPTPSSHPEQQAAEPWAGIAWAVVTANGIVQARCGRLASGGSACAAWRLSAPGASAWKPCYACGSAEIPAPVQVAGAEVADAVASARQPGTGPK
jgi:hypothetical protein